MARKLALHNYIIQKLLNQPSCAEVTELSELCQKIRIEPKGRVKLAKVFMKIALNDWRQPEDDCAQAINALGCKHLILTAVKKRLKKAEYQFSCDDQLLNMAVVLDIAIPEERVEEA